MRHFLRGGKGLPFCSGKLEPYTRPIKDTPTVYQLSSAQDLPWFYLCSTLLRSARVHAVTRLRLCIGAPSEHHHSHIGTPSNKGRTWLGLGRVLVGIKAGTANTIFRPISNPLRRFFAQSCPSHTLAMTSLYTGYEQEMPKSGTRNIQGLHKDETRNTQETSKRETRIALESTKDKTRNNQETPKPETRIRQESLNSTSKKTPERYRKGTGKVLKSGGKGTGEVLESYQRATKEVLTGSSFMVLSKKVRMKSPVSSSKDSKSFSVEDLSTNRLILRGFRLLCEEFRGKVLHILNKIKINEQRGLKCFGGFVSSKTKLEPIGEGCFGFAQHDVPGGEEQVLRYGSRFNFPIFPDSSGQAGTSGIKRGDDIKRPMAYSLQLIALMIFCVFSKALAQSPTKVGTVAKVKQEIYTKGLVIGDSLPDWFWEQELQVVNHPQKSKTIKLSAYKQQLLVLDFLNTACSGCIKSVDKWNELQPEYRREVVVLPVHLYGDNARIAPFAEKRGWNMPIATGNKADTLINQLFYVRYSFGQVWIKDGKLLAIPHNKDVSRALIGRALTRRDLGIQMNDMLTYFDRRYYIKEEE